MATAVATDMKAALWCFSSGVWAAQMQVHYEAIDRNTFCWYPATPPIISPWLADVTWWCTLIMLRRLRKKYDHNVFLGILNLQIWPRWPKQHRGQILSTPLPHRVLELLESNLVDVKCNWYRSQIGGHKPTSHTLTFFRFNILATMKGTIVLQQTNRMHVRE